MKESKLKKYFMNQISARELANDLKGSQQKTGYDTTSVTIERVEKDEFKVEKVHLVKLCDDYLIKEFTSTDLNTIGFALIFSDFFYWDTDTKSGEIIGQIVSDWDNENIGYDINGKNVQLWRQYLESGNYRLDKNELKQKFQRKGKWKRLYQEIDEILWNEWDPIGINDIAPRDEYQIYTPILFNLKRKGAKEVEIANRLHEIEKDTIGVVGNYEKCENAARKIINLIG